MKVIFVFKGNRTQFYTAIGIREEISATSGVVPCSFDVAAFLIARRAYLSVLHAKDHSFSK